MNCSDYKKTTGSYNTAIGYEAEKKTTGKHNTAVGHI
jgi:hypothetical protein